MDIKLFKLSLASKAKLLNENKKEHLTEGERPTSFDKKVIDMIKKVSRNIKKVDVNDYSSLSSSSWSGIVAVREYETAFDVNDASFLLRCHKEKSKKAKDKMVWVLQVSELGSDHKDLMSQPFDDKDEGGDRKSVV